MMDQSKADAKRVKILYTNYRGETALREIVPVEIVFGTTVYHPEAQWLLKAWALDRNEERHFSMKDIKQWVE